MDAKIFGMPDCVITVEYSSEEEWLELRKEGIGGSDAGAVMGLNKYTSPLKLFKIKRGIYTDSSDNVYTKKGKSLERLIFEDYVVPDPDFATYTLHRPKCTFINTHYPWLRANCDAFATAPNTDYNTVIEIKWVSEYAEVNWNEDEYCGVPASYYAQVQHYMTVTGAKYAVIYALFDKDWTVRKYHIPYDISFSLKLISQTREFYSMLLTGTAPKVSATLDKEFLTDMLESSPSVTEVSSEMSDIAAEYLVRKTELKESEKQVNALYDKLVSMYLEGKRPTDAFKMSMSTCKHTGFDTKRFADEHPDVYEQYKTTSEYTRTTVRKR